MRFKNAVEEIRDSTSAEWGSRTSAAYVGVSWWRDGYSIPIGAR